MAGKKTAVAKRPAIAKQSTTTRAKAPRAPAAPASRAKAAKARLTLAQAMAALEKAGSAQTRKTYLRHGAKEPLFGVSFATLQTLLRQIGTDHDLACALWETGNFDARNLAVKLADPARLTERDLDHWAAGEHARMCSGYVSALASEGPHGMSRARAWLASRDEHLLAAGWSLVSALALRDETTPDAWFHERVGEIERSVEGASNDVRDLMNRALIAIGGRSPGLRKAVEAAAKRIGPIEVDHGDTACKTPDPIEYLAKTWAHATSKGFDSPSAQERSRKSMRLRC